MAQIFILLILCPLYETPADHLARFAITPAKCFESYLAANSYLTHVHAHALPDIIGRAQVRDAEWRRSAWDHLDNAKRCRTKPEDVAYELSQLRALIGAENYKAGRMPSPIWSSDE